MTEKTRPERGAAIDAAIDTIATEFRAIKASEHGYEAKGRRTLDWRLVVSKLQNALLKPNATNGVVSIEQIMEQY
ncbi:MAG TPA: hypothetical protein DCG48_04450 [Rhodospirillaceae bacterium]|nr:hypothetical protein [Rhodospirillaceae bacterium]|tara:strand:+ start:7570 stop:7794 length:225 start_codon:yes stop_codon:yes gene_type:complete